MEKSSFSGELLALEFFKEGALKEDFIKYLQEDLKLVIEDRKKDEEKQKKEEKEREDLMEELDKTNDPETINGLMRIEKVIEF